MEPPMTDRLAALIKRIVELRQAGLKAYHCVEEFYLRQIRPLGLRKTLAFECPWMADPAATLQKVISSSFLHIVDNNLALIWHIFLYDATRSLKEIVWFISHLFDRGVLSARPGNVPLPYNIDNPPPLVRFLDFFKSFPNL
jgi:hypothetical protein